MLTLRYNISQSVQTGSRAAPKAIAQSSVYTVNLTQTLILLLGRLKMHNITSASPYPSLDLPAPFSRKSFAAVVKRHIPIETVAMLQGPAFLFVVKRVKKSQTAVNNADSKAQRSLFSLAKLHNLLAEVEWQTKSALFQRQPEFPGMPDLTNRSSACGGPISLLLTTVVK